ncbi:hypothetical protein NMY22_g2849 [Coprinellus aureogranulatus]|nr:hypothetical protein NMY22_g2849 [Coprinellus aureogranulatus]
MSPSRRIGYSYAYRNHCSADGKRRQLHGLDQIYLRQGNAHACRTSGSEIVLAPYASTPVKVSVRPPPYGTLGEVDISSTHHFHLGRHTTETDWGTDEAWDWRSQPSVWRGLTGAGENP